MIECDKYFNVMRMLVEGTVYDVAHALIYFEEIPIHQNIDKIVRWLNEKSMAVNNRPIKPELSEKLNQAVAIRKARLGDALWFSNN